MCQLLLSPCVSVVVNMCELLSVVVNMCVSCCCQHVCQLLSTCVSCYLLLSTCVSVVVNINIVNIILSVAL